MRLLDDGEPVKYQNLWRKNRLENNCKILPVDGAVSKNILWRLETEQILSFVISDKLFGL